MTKKKVWPGWKNINNNNANNNKHLKVDSFRGSEVHKPIKESSSKDKRQMY